MPQPVRPVSPKEVIPSRPIQNELLLNLPPASKYGDQEKKTNQLRKSENENLTDELNQIDGIFSEPFVFKESEYTERQSKWGQSTYRLSIWRLDCNYGPTQIVSQEYVAEEHEQIT